MENSVMAVGLDDSDHRFHALEWTLEHFFSPARGNPPFKLVVVHAKPSPTTAISLSGPVVEGDPRNVLCEAVEKQPASVLFVGSHGYGAIKRAVLGSVGYYCAAHHVHCSVMIVKRPKDKH